MLRLEGTCNRCGLCCMDGALRCINLEIEGTLGAPYATRCRVYTQRTLGMPILLVNAVGVIEAVASCTYMDNAIEDKEIMAKGIGKGCSLKVVNG